MNKDNQETPSQFFCDGYDIDNDLLNDVSLINDFVMEVKKTINDDKGKIVLIPYFNGKVKEDGGISVIILGDGFHFTCHTFSYKKTAFFDCYCEYNIDEKLLPIIIKYFNVHDYDLCKDNSEKTGNFGKHVIIKKCKKMGYDESIQLVKDIIKKIKMTPIYDIITNYKDEDNFDILEPIAESHISVHCVKGKMFIDIFSCKTFNENEVLSLLPDKTLITINVNRGIKYK